MVETRASKASPGIAFVLEMRNATRRKDYQLSESQKFFLDIALRMALAEHMSREGSPAPLFVDTPEGSLDIAYEARAGEMFAEFVKDGHSIIMTAEHQQLRTPAGQRWRRVWARPHDDQSNDIVDRTV